MSHGVPCLEICLPAFLPVPLWSSSKGIILNKNRTTIITFKHDQYRKRSSNSSPQVFLMYSGFKIKDFVKKEKKKKRGKVANKENNINDNNNSIAGTDFIIFRCAAQH